MDIFKYLAQLDLAPLPHTNPDRVLPSILNIVWGVTGAVAVIYFVYAGFKYVTSQGDPGKVAQAKNAVIYAAIGLVVSILAFSIVTFVVNRFG